MPRYENNQNRSYYIFDRVSYSIRRKPHGRKSIHVIGGKENLRATFNFSMLLVDAIILGTVKISSNNFGFSWPVTLRQKWRARRGPREREKYSHGIWVWLKSTNGKPIKIGFLYGLVSKSVGINDIKLNLTEKKKKKSLILSSPPVTDATYPLFAFCFYATW